MAVTLGLKVENLKHLPSWIRTFEFNLSKSNDDLQNLKILLDELTLTLTLEKPYRKMQ